MTSDPTNRISGSSLVYFFMEPNVKVYAAGTEDMDTLTFGTTILLRHLTFSEARKMPIKEFYLDQADNS